jgi:D-alanyl-D-alanine dipeptidase
VNLYLYTKSDMNVKRIPTQMIRTRWAAFLLIVLLPVLSSCREKVETPPARQEKNTPADENAAAPEPPAAALPDLNSLPDTAFVRLADYSDDFGFEMRYAGSNNFLKEAVYPCGECYTRVITAKALLTANAELQKKGFRIRFFDCYRPNSVQFKMWEIMPNPQYVANPVKGSIHNRGGAVDITLETLEGRKVDMGTDFDYFGPRAHHDHMDLPDEVLENRKRLKETMEGNGFWSIRTEWWHYNLNAASRYPVSDWVWACPSDKSPGK